MIPSIYYALYETDWRHYFSKNGAGEILWKKVRWTDQANHPSCALTVHGEISGKYRGREGKGMFCAFNTDEGWVESGLEIGQFRMKVQEVAVDYFESFAEADCRCRLGYHWKCGIHGKWRG